MPEAARSTGGSAANKGRILLVEDEFLLRLLMADELSDCGYIVTDVSTGADALAILEADRGFELVFTDIRLKGGINGWQVADAARRLIPDVRVVYTTGYSEQDGDRVPGSRLLLKPCGPQSVIETFKAMGVTPP